MSNVHLLSLVTFLPLFGIVFLLFTTSLRNSNDVDRNSRYLALFVSLITFFVSLFIAYQFDYQSANMQFVEIVEWLPDYNISYSMGIDGMALAFIVLTTFLTPIAIIASWEAITHKVPLYMGAFLVLETFMIGVFCATDLFLFYIFFEAVLIPMFLIIGVWGGEHRVYATFKLFLYTLLGSVLMLVAIIFVYSLAESSNLADVVKITPMLKLSVQKWLWLAFFVSFAVKIPMWPVHTWLPDAHVQAPTAGSVILAGILIKMGGYGMLRFLLPMFPLASQYFAPFVFTLSLIAIVYASLVALAQKDMKKLIAYSSVAHMGYVTLGIFTFNSQGIQGAVVQMISHGLVSAALFLCVGVVYDRMHTREIARYGGVVERMPRYVLNFTIFTMASIGLPGTSGFVGELLVLIGAYKVHACLTVIAGTGMILGAGYGLWLLKKVAFGTLVNKDLKSLSDLNIRERMIFAPIVASVIIFGIYPIPLLSTLAPSVNKVIREFNQSIKMFDLRQREFAKKAMNKKVKKVDK